MPRAWFSAQGAKQSTTVPLSARGSDQGLGQPKKECTGQGTGLNSAKGLLEKTGYMFWAPFDSSQLCEPTQLLKASLIDFYPYTVSLHTVGLILSPCPHLANAPWEESRC